jgi:hypothetical protein
MKTLTLHSIFGLLYTQQEIANFLGIKRETYTRACSTRDDSYIDYMIRVKARAIADIKSKKRYDHIRAAIENYK